MIIVAAVADLHIGSTVALCPPRIRRDDADEYRASKAQLWLWQCWNAYWDQIEAWQRELGGKVYFVCNGDLVEGEHHGNTQLWSANQADWARATLDVLERPMALASNLFFVRGTEAHVGPAGCLEEGIAQIVSERVGPRLAKDPQSGTASWNELQLDAGGVLFDFAHHGPMGRLEHTRLNALGRVAVQMELEALQGGYRVPDVACQAHNHRRGDSGDTYNIRVVAMPAWQLRTHFVRRITRSKLSDIGGIAFLCEGGKYVMKSKELTYIPKRSKKVIWSE